MNLEIKKYLYDISTSIDSIFEYLGSKRDFNAYKQNKLLRRGNPIIILAKKVEILYYTSDELQVTDSELFSPALSGNPLTNKQFINWIEQAENTTTVNFKEAKSKWASKRKPLQKLIK